MNGPESGALDATLWSDDSPRRPYSIADSEAKRTGMEAVPGIPLLDGGTPAAAPEAPALPSSALLDCDCHECRAVRAVASGLPYPVPPPILPPDEFDILRRLDKIEAHIANMESVLCMAIQVATTAAEIAKGRTEPEAA